MEQPTTPDPAEVREAIRQAAAGWNHSPPYTTPLNPNVQAAVDEYVETGDPAHLDVTAFRPRRDRLMRERAS